MEDCQQIKIAESKITTTKFMRGDICVATRIIKIGRFYTKERWYNAAGDLHRDGAPAEIHYKNGVTRYHWWYKNGKKHRDGDEPAEIFYDNDGQISIQRWYIDGKEGRKDHNLPAFIGYTDGKITSQCWWKDGEVHRDSAPAIIEYDDETGEIINRTWYKHGKKHRRNGPAVMLADTDGWFLHGVELKYENVPDSCRFPPGFRDVLRVLPIPISQAIMIHCRWKWSSATE